MDLSVQVGSVRLSSPVMTASGTSGHGAELGAYGDLGELGAVVVKSLSPWPWPGNSAPRVHPAAAGAGMLNSVGLENPGVEAWLGDELPDLVEAGATVVASLWGRTVEDFARGADILGEAPPAVVAVEVNVSCPNVEDRQQMFAHSCVATAEALGATVGCGRPRWAKLSPNVTDLVAVAGAAIDGGAEGLTLVNTLMGMALDPATRLPVLGAGGGGLSGPALHPVAVRAVYDCRAAFPTAAIVGVGGVGNGMEAAELMVAGADAVQVGTATFRDPRSPWKVSRELARWCRRHGVAAVGDLTGSVRRPAPDDGVQRPGVTNG
ncbi:MAG: dihydroorotate dehydrogenase [Acidimicrobiales bacterium]